jgi:hypothetical protein
VQNVEEVDMDKPLADPKELEHVPHGEIDALGMAYEGVAWFDSAVNNFVFFCRRIINHIFGNGNKQERFNSALEKVKYITRGTGVLTKALHSHGPFRRPINMAVTKATCKHFGGLTPEAMAEYERLYAIWCENFACPYFDRFTPRELESKLRKENFINETMAESSRWLETQLNVPPENSHNMSWKFISHRLEDMDVESMPWYEVLDPSIPARPPRTRADQEREEIVKRRGYIKQLDKDHLVKPSKKKRRRR